ncbi:UMP kinase [Methanopyrus sp.]
MYSVVALGGSVVNVDKPERIKETAEILRNGLNSGLKICVVVGGGPTARRYINVARNLGTPETLLDEMGIAVTRLNAMLLGAALGLYDLHVPETPAEAARVVQQNGVAVCGGTHPGHTTDAVAAMIAELLESPLVIVTNVDGVYDKDPSEPDARKLRELKPEELEELAVRAELKAGGSFVVDPLAAKMIRRGQIVTHVVSWEDFRSRGLENVVRGCHNGTIIEG